MRILATVQKTLQKFFLFYNKKDISSSSVACITESKQIGLFHSVSLLLHPTEIVDIIITHPSLDLLNNSDISEEAEKFAELLVYVTNSVIEPKILATIKEKLKNTENIKEQLFYNNVYTYYATIKEELQKNATDQHLVVRPREAFNVK